MHATPIFDELTERLREPWSATASGSPRPRRAGPPRLGVLSAVGPDGEADTKGSDPERPGETVLSFAAPSRARHARPS